MCPIHFVSGAEPFTAKDKFAHQCRQKLIKKDLAGFSGWDDRAKITDEQLASKLQESLIEGDYVDVANLAMMLYFRTHGGK